MTPARITIALDLMGGDHGPPVTFPAAVKALHKFPELRLILLGDGELVADQRNALDPDVASRIELIHCTDNVANDERPTVALRNKKESSMRRMLELVECGKAQACVSAGNTGALMAMAYYVLKTIPGLDRPALVSSMPTAGQHKVFLLDLGANVNCNAETLFQYAIMGSVLASQVAGIERPRVALLNVGEEDIKGNEQVKLADHILRESKRVNYIGYVEGDDIFTDHADVVVTDGFTGNVALKSSEGLAKLVIRAVKRVSSENWYTRFLAAVAMPLLKKVYHTVNPDQYNGASLLGLRGIVVKSHGNASADAFYYAIEDAIKEAHQQVPEKIKTTIESVLMERP
ncbi:phosphate acyltransferase PlsX [Aestuariibacter salexigens]|uniref:phosphate acyltransferase PlsX n=1 Tax=Aestuariibacter salexigens TaxID=226010 RepID=UPI000411D101|nr:phosphate acyltransferase PlsX [Aestuariibacter salexigens]